MAVETFHHPQLHHFVPLNSTRLKLRNLGVYSHKCCHGDMPWWCWIILRGSLMLYGPYIKSLRSWDGSGGLSSTSTATIYSFQEPSNSKILGYTHINVAMVTCPEGVRLLSKGHQTLCGPYIKSLKSWDDSCKKLSSTSTTTICCFFQEDPQTQKSGGILT